MVWNKSKSKPYFFLKLTLKHELMDFLEHSGIPVYPQKIERIGFQTTNGHVGDSVYHILASSSSSSSSSSNITNHHQPFINQHHHHRKRKYVSKPWNQQGNVWGNYRQPMLSRLLAMIYREPPPRSRDRLRHVFYCLWIGFINNQQEPQTNLNHLLLYGESLLAWWIESPWYLAINIGQQNLNYRVINTLSYVRGSTLWWSKNLSAYLYKPRLWL